MKADKFQRIYSYDSGQTNYQIIMLLAVKYHGVTEYKTTYLPSLKSIFIKKGNIFGMLIRRQRSPSKLRVHSPAIQIHMFYTVHVL